ncbi:MAG: nucleotidyltransferase domain-containing protein [Archaeoglobaceae archaeon]
MIKTLSLNDVADIVESIRKKLRGKALEAYVFGSIVDGFGVTDESDLDLLIVPGENLDWFELLEDEMISLLNLGIVLHLHIAKNESYRRILEIAKAKGVKLV